MPESPTPASSATPAPAPAPAVALWPAEVLARQLVSDDARIRTVALGMALQPNAPIEKCVDALVECARLSAGDALASQLAATALGCLPPASATEPAKSAVAAFLDAGLAVPIRIAAAHALFRLGCLPARAQDPLCAMLFDADPNARKVALLAVSPFAPACAEALARHVAPAPPAAWTVEALQALVKSAGQDNSARRKVEDFVMRSLAKVPLVPAGIAGYAMLAQLDPNGVGIPALVRVASDAANAEASAAALEALGALGEHARPAGTAIAQLLAATEDPAREELLCRTLVQMRLQARDVPIARVLQRVQGAPDRSTAAHCMLLCLHPKEFGQAAAAVQQRFQGAGEALRDALAQTYKTLTGTELSGGAAAGKA